MNRIWVAIRTHWPVVGLAALIWVFDVVYQQSGTWIPLGALALVWGIAAAVIAPAHPLRNGALGGLLADLSIVGLMLAWTILGTVEIAPGESLGSLWLELPMWLLILAIPAALLGPWGGGIVAAVAVARRRIHP